MWGLLRSVLYPRRRDLPLKSIQTFGRFQEPSLLGDGHVLNTRGKSHHIKQINNAYVLKKS